MARTRCRIGIDVGGTFTDFVLANLTTGTLTHYKEPSVPADPVDVGPPRPARP